MLPPFPSINDLRMPPVRHRKVSEHASSLYAPCGASDHLQTEIPRIDGATAAPKPPARQRRRATAGPCGGPHVAPQEGPRKVTFCVLQAVFDRATKERFTAVRRSYEAIQVIQNFTGTYSRPGSHGGRQGLDEAAAAWRSSRRLSHLHHIGGAGSVVTGYRIPRETPPDRVGLGPPRGVDRVTSMVRVTRSLLVKG